MPKHHHIEERLRQLADGRDDLVRAIIGDRPLNRFTLPGIIREILSRKYDSEPHTGLARDLQDEGRAGPTTTTGGKT